MGALNEGGPLYHIGGRLRPRRNSGGNVLVRSASTVATGFYHDGGKSLVDTHDKWVRFRNGVTWLNLGTRA